MKINGAGRRRRPREMHHAIVKFLFHYAYTLAVNGKTILLRLLLGKRTRTNEKSELKINFEKKTMFSHTSISVISFSCAIFKMTFFFAGSWNRTEVCCRCIDFSADGYFNFEHVSHLCCV